MAPPHRRSLAGPNPGEQLECIDDPAIEWDPRGNAKRADNYLCSNKDVGLTWSAGGAVPGLRCTKVNESSEPMRILAILPKGDASRSLLAHLGLPTEPPPPCAVGPPEPVFDDA